MWSTRTGVKVTFEGRTVNNVPVIGSASVRSRAERYFFVNSGLSS
jgi:hypothetical protein